MNPFCQCEQDGFCSRYGRQMSGRFRRICQGIDVDLGTACAFRQQWAQEAPVRAVQTDPIPLVLKTDQMPGDAVAMTAAVYSLHRAYPGKYLTDVLSPWPEVFSYNPDVTATAALPGVRELKMHYPAIHQSNDRSISFIGAYTEFLGSALGINLPLVTNRPHIYFSREAPAQGDFWVICSGGKRDFTTKLWGGYQEVVDRLRGKVRFVQVGAAQDDHPHLRGVTDLVGRTNLRQLFDWIRVARGVLCGISLLMHVAAALEKPSVIVAGGREPVAWNAYPRQAYLHTVGALPCRSTQGHVGQACWRSRVIPLGDGMVYDKDTCEQPENGFPRCMRLITPAEVAAVVLRYNQNRKQIVCP